MKKQICGIQQLGIGVPDVAQAWKWYYDNFGYKIKIVDADGVAERMLPYTGGKPQPRRSVIALNIRGGGGFEIWQPKGRSLNYFGDEVRLGDLGILAGKIKARDVDAVHADFTSRKLDVLTPVEVSPCGRKSFYMKDLYGNLFQMVEDGYVFGDDRSLLTGGADGAVIGVSDMDKSVAFYSKLLDYDIVAMDKTAVFEDLKGVPGGERELRRVVLRRSRPIEGPLSPVLGTSCLELVQAVQGGGRKLYEGRYWGDPGFIHLCFDIRGMAAIKEQTEALGHPFVCDSGEDFSMGDTDGHFTYVEDPDGTLIEFVETFKVPIFKKLGIGINLKDHPSDKPLRILKLLKYLKVKKEKIV